MRNQSPKQLVTVVVCLLVVAGTVPAVTAGAFTENGTEVERAVAQSGFQPASENVTVWDRAALPLRVNPNRNADTRIKNVDPFVEVSALGSGEIRLDRDTVAVYDDSAEIQLQFQRKLGAGTDQFAGQDVQLVAAHVEEDTAAARELLGSSSGVTTSAALDLLTGEEVNENVHFDLVEEYGTLDDEGEITATYDLGDENRGAGFYVFFLVQDHRGGDAWGVTDDGFEESDGNISVENSSRVLGADVATVHERPAEADPTRRNGRYTAGDDLTFDVDARQDDGEVTHALVVYDPRNFENRDVTLRVDGDLSDVTADDVTVVREVASVNGVASVSGSPNVFGLGDVQDGRVSGLIAGGRVVDFVAEQAGTDEPLDETTDDAVTLDASVTVVEGDDESQVTVETFENWSNGPYKYVYVATGEDSRELTTAQGRLTITQPRGQSGEVGRDGRFEAPGLSNDVPRVGIDFGEDARGTVKITQRASPGEGTPSVNEQENRRDPIYLDIDVPDDLSDRQSTVEVTVKKSSLDGLAPDEVALWHYDGTQWVELETTIVSQTGAEVTYSAVTDGFSPFAVAESTGPTGTATPEPDDGDDGDDADDRDPENDDDPAGIRADGEASATPESTETATPTATSTPTTDEPTPESDTATPAPDDGESTADDDAGSSGDAADGSETTSTQFPGLGVGVTLVAFVLALLLGRRRLN